MIEGAINHAENILEEEGYQEGLQSLIYGNCALPQLISPGLGSIDRSTMVHAKGRKCSAHSVYGIFQTRRVTVGGFVVDVDMRVETHSLALFPNAYCDSCNETDDTAVTLC